MAVSTLAGADGTGVAVKLGTLGLGLGVTRSLAENVNARVGFNNLTYSRDQTAAQATKVY